MATKTDHIARLSAKSSEKGLQASPAATDRLLYYDQCILGYTRRTDHHPAQNPLLDRLFPDDRHAYLCQCLCTGTAIPAQRPVSPLPAQLNDPGPVMYHHTRYTSNPFRRYPLRKHSTQSFGDVAEYHFFDSLLRITGCRLIRPRPF